VAPFIEGAVVHPAFVSSVDVINPSNGKHLLSVPTGSDADVDRAVASARRAFADGRWSEAPPSFRKTVLHRLAERIVAEGPALDALDAAEMGKPVGETLFNAVAGAGLVRFCAESVDKVMGDVFGSDKTSFVAQRRVPRGVVAAVVPWNFPTFNAVM
jgi:acyl-CoA reductase-like NAD-dependent aldehyde dehydrogenase